MSTVLRYFNANNNESYDKIIDWAYSALTPEQLTEFNLSLQRNTERYNNLLANNFVVEKPIFEEFYSNVLQSNITSTVGTAVTYNFRDDNLDYFKQDTTWEYYLDRYLKEHG